MNVFTSNFVSLHFESFLVTPRATYVVDGQFFAHFFWKVEGTVHIHINSHVAHMWPPCRMKGGAF